MVLLSPNSNVVNSENINIPLFSDVNFELPASENQPTTVISSEPTAQNNINCKKCKPCSDDYCDCISCGCDDHLCTCVSTCGEQFNRYAHFSPIRPRYSRCLSCPKCPSDIHTINFASCWGYPKCCSGSSDHSDSDDCCDGCWVCPNCCDNCCEGLDCLSECLAGCLSGCLS